MKKLLACALSLILLAGCGSNNPTAASTPTPSIEATPEEAVEQLSLLIPRGAPAIALLPAYLNSELYTVTSVDGSDPLQSAFVNPNPEYDVIVAPSNLGAKLASTGNTTYRMLGVITWGNLYLVGTSEDALNQPGTLAAFGEGAVPQKVLEQSYPEITPDVVYYNAVTDAQAALLSGQADLALLAEPAATATIAKAKENGLDLVFAGDLQEAYGEGGYPQAAIFVREDNYADIQHSVDVLIEKIVDYNSGITEESIVADIEQVGADELGVPNAALIYKVYDRMNIRYQSALMAKEALSGFLGLFGIEDVEPTILNEAS